MKLSGYLNVQSRTLYNMWDLLGDIGGFYDGLLVVASMTFGFYSAFQFRRDFAGSVAFDNDEGKAPS